MTDYGVLSQKVIKHTSRVLPIWTAGWNFLEDLGSFPSNGSISGHVSVDGVAQANKEVYIYYRRTGKLVDVVKTNSAGDYVVTGLDPTDTSNYFAVCLTDADYNGIVFNKVTAG